MAAEFVTFIFKMPSHLRVQQSRRSQLGGGCGRRLLGCSPRPWLLFCGTPACNPLICRSDQRRLGSMSEGINGVGSDLFGASLCQSHLPGARAPGIPAPLLRPRSKAADLLLRRTSSSGGTHRSKVKDRHTEEECVEILIRTAEMSPDAVCPALFHQGKHKECF